MRLQATGGLGHAQPEQAGLAQRAHQRLGQPAALLGLRRDSAAVAARRRAASTGSVVPGVGVVRCVQGLLDTSPSPAAYVDTWEARVARVVCAPARRSGRGAESP